MLFLTNQASMTQINIGGVNQPISIEVRNFKLTLHTLRVTK